MITKDDYNTENVSKSPHIGDLEKYVRLRLYSIFGWYTGGFSEMKSPPKLLHAYSGTVSSKLRAERDKIHYPSDKYVKVSERGP